MKISVDCKGNARFRHKLCIERTGRDTFKVYAVLENGQHAYFEPWMEKEMWFGENCTITLDGMEFGIKCFT